MKDERVRHGAGVWKGSQVMGGFVNSTADERTDGRRAPAGVLAASGGSKRQVVSFRAELDLTELDDRQRPGPTWMGRGSELSRSGLTFVSRRMCYEGRSLLLAVHLVDDRPVPLFGTVRMCEYDGDGMYRTSMILEPIPNSDLVKAWVSGRELRGQM